MELEIKGRQQAKFKKIKEQVTRAVRCGRRLKGLARACVTAKGGREACVNFFTTLKFQFRFGVGYGRYAGVV